MSMISSTCTTPPPAPRSAEFGRHSAPAPGPLVPAPRPAPPSNIRAVRTGIPRPVPARPPVTFRPAAFKPCSRCGRVYCVCQRPGSPVVLDRCRHGVPRVMCPICSVVRGSAPCTAPRVPPARPVPPRRPFPRPLSAAGPAQRGGTSRPADKPSADKRVGDYFGGKGK